MLNAVATSVMPALNTVYKALAAPTAPSLVFLPNSMVASDRLRNCSSLNPAMALMLRILVSNLLAVATAKEPSATIGTLKANVIVLAAPAIPRMVSEKTPASLRMSRIPLRNCVISAPTTASRYANLSATLFSYNKKGRLV